MKGLLISLIILDIGLGGCWDFLTGDLRVNPGSCSSRVLELISAQWLSFKFQENFAWLRRYHRFYFFWEFRSPLGLAGCRFLKWKGCWQVLGKGFPWQKGFWQVLGPGFLNERVVYKYLVLVFLNKRVVDKYLVLVS